MKSLNDWLASAKTEDVGAHKFRITLPYIKCADGTRLSVQAGDGLYCTPRNNDGPWTHVEVGFPSVAPGPLWMPYCEDPEAPTETVYAYVPVELVIFYIAAHGGSKFE